MIAISLIGRYRMERRDTRRSDRSALLYESGFAHANFGAINVKLAVVAVHIKFDLCSVYLLVRVSRRTKSALRPMTRVWP